MNPFSIIFQALYAAKISGALYELGIDVKKFDREMARKLFEIEKSSYKKESAHEAALWFLFVHGLEIPKETYLLPISTLELFARAIVIVDLWMKKGKISSSEAKLNLESLQMQIDMASKGIKVTTR